MSSGRREIADVTSPSGVIKANTIVKNMNTFIQDCLAPFATWLKTKYPDLSSKVFISSTSRGYVPKGGSSTSQHFLGEAVDFSTLGGGFKTMNDNNLNLLNAILEWYKENPVGYSQILFETRKGSQCWVHWAYRRGHKRLDLKRFVNDGIYAAKVNNSGKYIIPPINPDDIKLYV